MERGASLVPPRLVPSRECPGAALQKPGRVVRGDPIAGPLPPSGARDPSYGDAIAGRPAQRQMHSNSPGTPCVEEAARTAEAGAKAGPRETAWRNARVLKAHLKKRRYFALFPASDPLTPHPLFFFLQTDTTGIESANSKMRPF